MVLTVDFDQLIKFEFSSNLGQFLVYIYDPFVDKGFKLKDIFSRPQRGDVVSMMWHGPWKRASLVGATTWQYSGHDMAAI